MITRAAAGAFGAAFGFLISWGQFSDPGRIRDMLLLSDPYLYVMMGVAILVAYTGIQALRRREARTLLTGEPVGLQRGGVERRHVVGAAIFGLGWALTASCPAPVAAQLAQGVAWGGLTAIGIFAGIALRLRLA